MTREELFAMRKQAKWERLARLQQQVMPMIFGMGDAFAVTEVDIRPDDRVIIVFGSFRDEEAMIRIERPLNGGPIAPWIELKIVDNPESLPKTCPALLKELEENDGVELLFRRDWMALATEAHGCTDGAELRSVFDHLLASAARAREILTSAKDDTVPFDAKRGTIAVPRRDALMN